MFLIDSSSSFFEAHFCLFCQYFMYSFFHFACCVERVKSFLFDFGLIANLCN